MAAFGEAAIPDRIWAYICRSENDPCWQWLASPDLNGYGRVRAERKRWQAHRYVYTKLVGEIPEGLHIDHLCGVRMCVNPEHLEPVTAAENNRRKALFYTTCRRGHPYTEKSTYISADRPGTRQCRICIAANARRRRARLADVA